MLLNGHLARFLDNTAGDFGPPLLQGFDCDAFCGIILLHLLISFPPRGYEALSFEAAPVRNNRRSLFYLG